MTKPFKLGTEDGCRVSSSPSFILIMYCLHSYYSFAILTCTCNNLCLTYRFSFQLNYFNFYRYFMSIVGECLRPKNCIAMTAKCNCCVYDVNKELEPNKCVNNLSYCFTSLMKCTTA